MRPVVPAALMALLLAAAAGAQQPRLVLPEVALASAWTPVPLPDRPLDVVAHDGALWECGANQSVARSRDGGRHWQLLARRPGGQMLFSLTFPDAATITAFGTEGVRLISRDDGATWTQAYSHPTRSIVEARAVTGNIVAGRGASGYAISTDAGGSWSFHEADSDVTGRAAKALAVGDAWHVGLVLDAPAGKAEELLTSSDGGHHFQKFSFAADYEWNALRATATGFTAYGFRGATDFDRGTPAAAAFDQTHGWQLLTGVTEAYDNCTAQGCLLDGGWEDFSGPQPQRWGLPADAEQPLVRTWAAQGDTFCEVSQTLRCRSGREPWTKAAPRPPSPGAYHPPCIACGAPRYPVAARYAHRQGKVVIAMMVSAAGTPYDLVLQSASSVSLAESSLSAVRAWLYKPHMVNGRPTAFSATIEIRYTLSE
ncbi:MAG: TonB family protein [Terriglobales bacterium]